MNAIDLIHRRKPSPPSLGAGLQAAGTLRRLLDEP